MSKEIDREHLTNGYDTARKAQSVEKGSAMQLYREASRSTRTPEVRKKGNPFAARLVPPRDPGHTSSGLSRGDACQAQSRYRSRDGKRQKGAARTRPLVDLRTNEILDLVGRLQQLAGLDA
jgi:hypothetical protein